MTFQRHLCWQKDRIYTVMNTDAENVQDDVFLAVHSDHPLIFMDPKLANPSAAARWRMEPGEFLHRFLDPNRHHVQAVIQGESGSGKSHFIKWMTLNMPRLDDLCVLIIPKAGMSLRRIVELIIGVLPQEKQQPYQDRLHQVGQHVATREQRRENLINRIAEAINSDPRRAEAIGEEEEWLIEQLPNIFYDPYLRTFLDKQGGIIDDLVEHIFEAPQNYRRLENQRVFGREDLPLNAGDLHQMSRKAQQALSPLVNDPKLVSSALTVINRNVNRAIPLVLNFTGDQLVELMLDLRRSLREEKKNLVLLIEDFARLQGIDGALLQALIEAGSEANGLCEIRWAMAITRGYYEPIRTSVQTRTDFLIDMDLSTSGPDAVVNDDFMIAFAARYLNAVRLPGQILREWFESNRNSVEAADVPNACDSCQFRDTCHGAFEATDGLGLYPFSRSAILNMARRKDPHLDERFNPRILIKDVLAELLGNYGNALEEGKFPPDQLLQVMGGSKLTPRLEDHLKRSNPEQFLRQRALLDLWSPQPGMPVDLPKTMYDAFTLEPVKLEGIVSRGEQGGEEKNKPTPGPTTSDRRIAAIQEWGRGGKLTEQVAQELRDPIYEMLESYIDWDAEGLERTKFARRADGPFRTRYIIFRDQQTLPPVAPQINLTIPLDGKDEDERRESAIALEGLLRFRENRDWNFNGGVDAFVALSNCLERWSNSLVNQFHSIPTAEWNGEAITVAVEMLAIGATLAGRPAKSEATLVDYLNVLFEDWPPHDEITVQSREWKDLYKVIYARKEAAVDVVRAWASGTKGGQAGAFIDPRVILHALKHIRRTWTPNSVTPKNILARSDEYGKMATVYMQIRNDLALAAQAEFKRKMTWLGRVRQNIPEGVSRLDVVKQLEELHRVVNECGVGCRPTVIRPFTDGLGEFRRVQLDEAIRSIEALRQSENIVQILPQLARDRANNAIAITERFFPAVEEFLSEVTAGVNALEANLGHEEQTLRQDQERIDTSLDRLHSALSVFEGGGQHAN